MVSPSKPMMSLCPMRSTPSAADVRIIQHEADIAARRLQRRYRLSRDDLEDFRQDLITDLLARLGAFDPTRGQLGAFAGRVMANRATRLAQRITRHRRMYGARPVSLDEIIPDTDGLTRGDLIAEEEGLSAHLGQPVDAFIPTEHRIDVERGVGSLEPGEGALCAALSHASVDRLATTGHGARSSIYRRIKNIRLALTAAGVGIG
jgi:hypothetical protein